jgi:hypothetical protein
LDLKENAFDDPSFLSNVITGDETWVHAYNLETKTLLLSLMWLYNSFVEFWPSQPTPSIFLYPGQESSNLEISTFVYLF